MDRDELIGVFKYALQQLDTNENGITENNQLADLNATAALCLAIKTLTASGDTLEELCLRRLAALTEDLLVAPWVPNQTTVKEWLIARGELLQEQIPRA